MSDLEPTPPACRGRLIAFDLTHLTTRLLDSKRCGIRQVDEAYARHFAKSERLACGAHYGAFRPHVLPPGSVAALARFHERTSGYELPDEGSWRDLRNWLLGRGDEAGPSRGKRAVTNLAERSAAFALMTRLRLANDRNLSIPPGSVYLNVAQYGFEYPRLFRWLDHRPDVAPAFFVHDLLPLDYPEFFRDGYEAIFRKRFDTIIERASAILTSSRWVAERIEDEFRRRKREAPPLLAQPLASPLGGARRDELHDAELSASPYFVIVATIEPRKNHLLALNVWRDLASSHGSRPPKLVCVGGRGWGNAQIFDLFDKSAALGPHVRYVSELSPSALRRLLANARALLAPSFAEGYGIPLVEALEIGTPVICSDIPVFREVTQNCAMFLSLLDGVGWRDAIREFSRDASSAREEAVTGARRFGAPSWAEHFEEVERFLASL